jgi:integrase/recombinase XerD
MSVLSVAADDYLAIRHRLGHKLADAERLLPRFVAYLDASGTPAVTTAAALAWATQPDAPPGSVIWPHRMTVARGFARHMAGIDPATEVPPLGLLPSRVRWRPPFIYTPGDIDALMRQARTSIGSPLVAETFATLIGLLAVTGMRIGEVIRLDRTDVDLDAGVVLVRESKFHKSRLVPLHASTIVVLGDYAAHRDDEHPRAVSTSFFVTLTGKRLIYEGVWPVFRHLCDTAGIGAGATRRPRLHDLRHTFAVATLVDWYRTGADVNAKLPMLSTYLGHHEPRYTYWYLSAAPELLALAAGRLEAAGELAVTP